MSYLSLNLLETSLYDVTMLCVTPPNPQPGVQFQPRRPTDGRFVSVPFKSTWKVQQSASFSKKQEGQNVLFSGDLGICDLHTHLVDQSSHMMSRCHQKDCSEDQ